MKWKENLKNQFKRKEKPDICCEQIVSKHLGVKEQCRGSDIIKIYTVNRSRKIS